jgi:hypothetical protein
MRRRTGTAVLVQRTLTTHETERECPETGWIKRRTEGRLGLSRGNDDAEARCSLKIYMR